MTPAQADAIRRYTSGVLRARRAYFPDHIRLAADCAVPGCTNAAWSNRIHCRNHRGSDALPDVVNRLAEG